MSSTPYINSRLKRKLIPLCAASVLFTGCYSGEQGDNGSEERMKNAIVTIATGIAAQERFGDSGIYATVDRPAEIDSNIVGTTSADTIDVRMKIPMQDNIFQARKVMGRWTGAQDKHMFDWGIKQIGPNRYEIDRVGFNGTLEVYVAGKSINGVYERTADLDYAFEGRIEDDGTYELKLDIPAELDWHVKGRIMRR